MAKEFNKSSTGLKLVVFAGVVGFWSMGLFAITDGYWFIRTTKLGNSTNMLLGDHARTYGIGLLFFGLVFLSLVQKNALRGGLLAGLGIIGAIACMLAPAYIK